MAYKLSIPFNGKIIETTVTAKASVADEWLTKLRSPHEDQVLIVGLNCKWKPHPVSSLRGKIVTMQLCVDADCLILQLPYMNHIPLSLKNFLSDPRAVFVGIEVDEMISKLKTEYELRITKNIDVRTLAKLHFPLSFSGNPGLKVLAYQLLQLRAWKPKNICLNDLECGVLDMEVIKLACVDAYICYGIGKNLLLQEKQ